jgi:hypothetical protein
VKKFARFLPMAALLLVASTAILPRPAAAEDIKPVITVSFAGYEAVRANIEAIGKLGGNPQLAQGLEALLAMQTQGKGLAGLDKNAPWGAVVQFSDGGTPTGFGFLPVTDLKQFMDTLKNTPVGGEITETDGIYEVATPDGETMYIAQRGKVAAIVKDKAALELVPAEPEKLLGDLPKKYLVAVQVTVKNIPEALREQGLGMVSMVMQMGLQRTEDETDEQFALREKMSKRTIEQLTMFVKEMDQFLIGLNIDRQTNKVALDFEMVALEGTTLAGELAKAQSGKTDLAGFDLPGAALVANSIGTMTDKDIADAKDTFKNLHDMLLREVAKQELTEAQMKLVKELLADAVAIAEKNLETKKSDAGLALLLDPAGVTLVAGSSVAEGKPIEDLVKKFFDAAKAEEPALADAVKFNAETYKDVRFHLFSMPTPDEALKPFVGDTLEVVLGVSEKQAFVAAGRDAVKVLKQAIDKSQAEAGKDVLPFQMSLSALQVAKFLAAVAPEEEVKAQAQMVASMLEQASGKDHVVITAQSIANGVRVHLELEEGFMKLLGSASQMLGGLGGMPGGQN